MDHPPSHQTTPATPLPNRRNFFLWLTYALGAIAAAIVGAPLVGYFLGVRKRSDEWVAIGSLKEFLPENAEDPGAVLPVVAGSARRRRLTFTFREGLMMRALRAVGAWLEARLGLRDTLLHVMKHPIPRGAAGPMGWWYVFGSASMTLLGLQVITGIGLALVYVPAADKAYDSLLYLNYQQPLGWFLRALHYYAGSGMVVMVLLHMTQVFLHATYKYPRELTWVVGVFLLLWTLGMFFTGQVLRWDPDACCGLAVAGSMAGRPPGLGREVLH